MSPPNVLGFSFRWFTLAALLALAVGLEPTTRCLQNSRSAYLELRPARSAILTDSHGKGQVVLLDRLELPSLVCKTRALPLRSQKEELGFAYSRASWVETASVSRAPPCVECCRPNGVLPMPCRLRPTLFCGRSEPLIRLHTSGNVTRNMRKGDVVKIEKGPYWIGG